MVIDIWTDSMFFDLTFEQERDEDFYMNKEKELPNLTFEGRKYNWNLIEEQKGNIEKDSKNRKMVE